MKWEVSKARNERQLRREIKGDVTALPMPATPPSSAAPPAEGDLPIVTPPTSPQEHQQAGHDQECTLHQMGSPEQCRTPAVPLHPLPPPPIVVGGRALTHLPADLAALAATVPSHPTSSRQRGRGRPQQLPFPLPPPPPSVASGSVLGSGPAASSLGPPFVPSSTSVPLPPNAASSSTAHPSEQILNRTELAARYAALPPLLPPRTYAVWNPVSVNY